MILWNRDDLTKVINSSVFPYSQGGPLENIIAGKAIMAEEALQPDFKTYIQSVKRNTRLMSQTLRALGYTVTDTENHLFLLDTLKSFGLTGLEAQKKLEEIKITTNKNMLPKDTLSPAKTSGLRIGCAAITTRGASTIDAIAIGTLIGLYLDNKITKEDAEKQVAEITAHLQSID